MAALASDELMQGRRGLASIRGSPEGLAPATAPPVRAAEASVAAASSKASSALCPRCLSLRAASWETLLCQVLAGGQTPLTLSSPRGSGLASPPGSGPSSSLPPASRPRPPHPLYQTLRWSLLPCPPGGCGSPEACGPTMEGPHSDIQDLSLRLGSARAECGVRVRG